MSTNSGELREMLVSAIEAVTAGKLAPDEASAIAKLAQQINLSLQVEANMRESGYVKASTAIGALPLGDERPVVEMEK